MQPHLVAQCPRVARSSSSAETRRAAQGQDEMEDVWWLLYEHGTARRTCDCKINKQRQRLFFYSSKTSVRSCVKIGKCWSVHGRQTFSRSFVSANHSPLKLTSHDTSTALLDVTSHSELSIRDARASQSLEIHKVGERSLATRMFTW